MWLGWRLDRLRAPQHKDYYPERWLLLVLERSLVQKQALLEYWVVLQ
jgi:hypothetical protein